MKNIIRIDSLYQALMLPIVVATTVILDLFPVRSEGGLPCLIKEFTGFECWGCGITRSIISLLHGEIQKSLDYNKLGPIVLLIIIALSIKQYYLSAKKKEPKWQLTSPPQNK